MYLMSFKWFSSHSSCLSRLRFHYHLPANTSYLCFPQPHLTPNSPWHLNLILISECTWNPIYTAFPWILSTTLPSPCLTWVPKKILLHLLSYVLKTTKSESKTLTDTSPKKIYTDATEPYEKMLHIICPQGNVKQWDAATHLWGWTKSRRRTTPNAGEDGQQECSFVAGEFGPS